MCTHEEFNPESVSELFLSEHLSGSDVDLYKRLTACRQ